MDKVLKPSMPCVGQDVEELELSAYGNVKCCTESDNFLKS